MSDKGLAIALLGPLDVRLRGAPVRLPAGRVRALLAVLAVSAGDTVPVDRLARALWGDDPPVNARRSIQTYMVRLRHVLGAAAIGTRPEGYLLDADPERVDVLRFRRLLGLAERARGTAGERAPLEEALALWRGEPFGGVDSAWLGASVSVYLTETYMSALERRADLDLAEGRHGELIPELMELAARHPLRESLWERLLVALGRCGRQAEALNSYEKLRRHLAEELGADPSERLRRIHAALLAHGPGKREVAMLSGQAEHLPGAGGVAGFCVISGTAGARRSFLALIWNTDAGPA